MTSAIISVSIWWITISFAISIAIYVVGFSFVERGSRILTFLFIFGLAGLGATVGLLGGLSRVGVTGEIVAASLGLLGGVATYLFAVKPDRGAVVSICTLVFSMSLLVSYVQAANMRTQPERLSYWRDYCLTQFLIPETYGSEDLLQTLQATVGPICANVISSERLLIDRMAER